MFYRILMTSFFVLAGVCMVALSGLLLYSFGILSSAEDSILLLITFMTGFSSIILLILARQEKDSQEQTEKDE